MSRHDLQLTLFFHSLALLCSLASVVFVALDARPRAWAAISLGFAVGVLAVWPERLPDPTLVGGGVAALSGAALWRPRSSLLASGAGGVLAGFWAAMLWTAGIPVPVAMVTAVAVLALALLCSRRSDFAPPVLREEALFVVLLLGLGVAVAPGVAAGWQSAAVLNLQTEQIASQAVPAWTLLVTGGAATLGGLYTVWMRR